MNIEQIRNLILGTRPDPSRKGRAFEVTFYKTTGESRTMRARLGMKRGLKGKGLAYNPADHGLVGVWECNNGYRMIPLNRIVSLRLPDNSKHLKEVIRGSLGVKAAYVGQVSATQ